MQNHAEALEGAGLTAQADLWREEILSLERSERSVPFADGGIPVGLRTDFAPYQARLEAVYCPETASFELNTIRKKGLSIQAD
jgi:hypothetical protein